jgi:TPR repeat protein
LRGSSVAAFYLGMAHEQGAVGLPVNLNRARYYYELASARGNAEAKYNLAVFHQQGLGGLAASEAEAGRLLAEAAADGVPEARSALGLQDRRPADVAAPTVKQKMSVVP